MQSINAYINFNGACREAMSFYRDCLGGALNFMPVAGSPIAEQCPAAVQDWILHASLVSGPVVIMASDMSGPEGPANGNMVALSVNCSDEEEISRMYTMLSAGGTIIDELKPQFWATLSGVFTDKFGIRWMLTYIAEHS